MSSPDPVHGGCLDGNIVQARWYEHAGMSMLGWYARVGMLVCWYGMLVQCVSTAC